MAVFDEHMPQPNQIHVRRDDVRVNSNDLIAVPSGTITEAGIRDNLSVGLQYMEAWLRGVGCVPINYLVSPCHVSLSICCLLGANVHLPKMEDAATAEISRSQLWQWARHQPKTAEGKTVTAQYLLQLLDEEVDKIRKQLGPKYASSKFDAAKAAFATNITGQKYDEFLTTLLYDDIVTVNSRPRL